MADAKSKKTEPAQKIVDVKSDGDAASGTSRPVIVTNRAILKDPMMAEVSQLTGGLEEPKAVDDTSVKSTDQVEGAPELVATSNKVTVKVSKNDAAEPAEAAKAATPPSKKKIIISPISDPQPEKATAPSTKKKEPTIADLAKPDPLDEVKKLKIPEASEDEGTEGADAVPGDTEDSETEQTSKEDAAPEETVPQDEVATGVHPGRSFDETEETVKPAGAGTELEQTGLDEKGHAKKKVKNSGELTSEQEKAIETGQYFLPITTAETRRLRREIVLATLFVAVLIVVWLDIMLDAGLLSIGGIKAVTNFF